VFLVECTLTLPTPPGSGTHHPHSERCPQMEKAWYTHRNTQLREGYKTLHHCRENTVPGRKIAGRKLHIVSVSLSLFAPSLQLQNSRMYSTERPIVSHKQHCQNISKHPLKLLKQLLHQIVTVSPINHSAGWSFGIFIRSSSQHMSTHHPSSIRFLYLLHQIQGCRGVESMHWVRGRVLPGQVASPSQGHTETNEIAWIDVETPVNLAFTLLGVVRKRGKNPCVHGENMQTPHRKAPARIQTRNPFAVRRQC